MPRRAQMALHAVAMAMMAQATLGISALLLYVPVWLGALHQSGALITISSALWLTHELRRVVRL